MKLQQLRYLVQVAESGSFTKAANRLNLAQAALSRQIRLLEDELGVMLFKRDGRGVETTAAGRELVERANALFADLHDMRQSVMRYRGTQEGNVTIGMMPLLGACIVPSLLLKAREMYPNVRINFMVGMAHAIQEWAISGRIDFGVVSTAIPTSAYLVSDEFLSDRLHLVTAVNSPLARLDGDQILERAVAEPLVIPSKLNGIRAVLDRAALERQFTIDPVIEVDSLEIIKRLIPTGIGRAILPRFAIADEVEAGTFYSNRIIEPELHYRMAITFPVERPLSPSTSAIAEMLRNVATTELKIDRGRP